MFSQKTMDMLLPPQESIPNHTINPETGFLESNNYPDAFNSPKKLIFIEKLMNSDFDLTATCSDLGISKHTFFKHCTIDKAFNQAVSTALNEYKISLDWVSKSEAIKPKNTLERFFQLKALFPERYAREEKNNSGNIKVTINMDSRFLENARMREQAIETKMVENEPQNSIDNHNSYYRKLAKPQRGGENQALTGNPGQSEGSEGEADG